MIKKLDKYRLLLENLPDGFAYHQMVWDSEGNPIDYIFLDVNCAFEEMTGLNKEDIIGKNITQVMPRIKEDGFDWISAYGKVAAGEGSMSVEQFSEPLQRWFEVKAYCDELGYFCTIFHNISKRKQAHDDLQSQLRFQRMLSHISSSLMNIPINNLDYAVNRALHRVGAFFGADRSYIFLLSNDGKTLNNSYMWYSKDIKSDVSTNRITKFHEEDVGWWKEQIADTGIIKFFDTESLPMDAEHERARFLLQGIKSIYTIPMFYNKKFYGFLAIDYLRQKKQLSAELLSLLKVVTGIISDALSRRQAENEKNMVLNTISEKVAYLDTDFRFIWANRIVAESYAKTSEELCGMRCYELWHNREEPCLNCPIQKAKETKQPQEGEIVTKDGATWHLRGYPIFDDENELVALVKIGQDITHEKQAAKDLLESENRFRQLVEIAPDAIYVQTDGLFAYLNQAAIDLFGATSKEDLIGKSVMERFHPDFYEAIAQRIHMLNEKKKSVPVLEQIYLRLDGTPVDVEVSAVPITYNNKNGALVYTRDISERKKLERSKAEEQVILRQQQKLEAIGVLASGVAHEINNPINGIMNYGQLILDNAEKDSQEAEYATEIIKETERVSMIVRNLLQFSRQEKQSHSYAKIEDIIDRTLSLIRTLFRRDQITLELDIPEDLPDLKCRSQQIEQVLMNLMTNARDALNNKYLGYHDEKVIRISCSLFERDNRRWLRVTVEDKGTGISDSDSEKLFQPFFTTKPRDEGTGLGLAISYGIVKDHHGEISFETKPGCYTRFFLDLPIDNGWTMAEMKE